MYIMRVCLFSTQSRRLGALQISIIIINWANVRFANLVRVIRRTAMKLYSGSKKLRSSRSGNICPVGRTLPLTGWEQSSPVYEDKIKMDYGVVTSLASEGIALFVDLWEAQACLCDPEWYSS